MEHIEEKLARMKELSAILSKAEEAYYQKDSEIMSNLAYDRLYDELSDLERETGIVLSASPTHRVGYEVLDELPKEAHPTAMLSLDKTKEVAALEEWLGEQTGLLSWKLDGLTIVLTYEGGTLTKAVTRGNGQVGEVITNNARVFENVPLTIGFAGSLVLRGEAVIRYSDFERMNREMEDAEGKYKNPRNLCSGSVRQLNNEVTAKRHVNFMAFALVQAEGMDFGNSRARQFRWMESLGFSVVECQLVTRENVAEKVACFSEAVKSCDLPSDGLVLTFEDIAYGESLGRTAKFPRNSIAFKWADEVRQTTLSYMEWSPSRTGLINPVAVFETVELEGTDVSRASVHNISIMESLELGEGDVITVYKANMIIPQIADNLTRSGVKNIPKTCPVCGGETQIRQVNDVKALFCTNPECQAKKIKSFSLLVSRDALNIDGLSDATLEKFIGAGFIKEFADIFRLEEHREAIVSMEGFGQKSYEKLMQAIADARRTTLVRVVYGLGVAGIGLANARMLCRQFQHDFKAMRSADGESLMEADGIGQVLADAWRSYFADPKNQGIVDRLLAQLTLEPEKEEESGEFAGMTFVITGSVKHFKNRKQLQALIESRGGKAAGSVTSRTTYLINNDASSASSKNKKARELGIPILSEEDFIKLLEGEHHAD